MSNLDPECEGEGEENVSFLESARRKLRGAFGMSFLNNNKTKSRAIPTDALKQVIEEARYEVEVDPYRGIFVVGDYANPSPWGKCRMGSVSSSAENDVGQDYSSQIVQQVCQNACPCLIQWTQDEYKRTRKRKKPPRHVLGGRPSSAQCRCDYNPFCLGSLGGVMDEILEERLKMLTTEKVESDDDSVTVKEEPDLQIDPYKPNSIYNEETAKELKKLRKGTVMDIRKVRAYLSRTLQGLTAALPLDECIQILQSVHQQLAFANPLSKSRASLLSIPPGIENLGATCYLNTQLQCLAQNLVFVNGIFAWRSSPDTADGMERVLLLFQQLLAEMRAGARNTVVTREFSNALELDHMEQQDPNEFSRLFLELIHESFQATAGDEASPHNLAQLLPDLFQGRMVYETTCSSCKSVSRRREEFMDLNLPIEHPETKKSGQLRILESLQNDSDIDLQFCLHKYCESEELTGDNQYLCGVCNAKRDATRSMSFQKLPPVLNVQLSRYVFDRQKFVKKKLSDPVLLPLEVHLPSRNRHGPSEHRYVLCAVMRHQGKSAYSGHYVAEAMDWLTGQWFEFNDEKVTLLNDGPSSSYDPSKISADNKDKAAGSKDAYNMYYVEEGFLAQSTLDTLRNVRDVSTAGEVTNGTTPGAVELVSMERLRTYADAAELCKRDGEGAHRLAHRRELIRNKVFPDWSSLKPGLERVWVEGESLRRFLSSQECGVLSTSRSLLCEHERPGLHPRIARRGKLVARKVYEELLVARGKERPDLGDSGLRQSVVVVSPSSGLECEQCSKEYCKDLGDKLRQLELVAKLYDILDPKEKEYPLEFDPAHPPTEECDLFVYLVSRKFSSSFRTRVTGLIKMMGQADSTKANSNTVFEDGTECLAEGLDALHPSYLSFHDDSDTSDTALDPTVNGQITCEHGRCCAANRREFKCVSQSTWKMLAELFPSAIEHRSRRFSAGSDSDDTDLVCPKCKAEDDADEGLYARAKELACLKGAKPFQPVSPDAIIASAVNNGEIVMYRVLWREDLLNWSCFLKVFQAKDRRFAGSAEFEMKNILRRGSTELPHPTLVPPEGDTLAEHATCLKLLSTFVRSLVCPQHKLPIQSLLFEETDRSSQMPHLSRRVSILDERAYQEYLIHLCAVAMLLAHLEGGSYSERTLVDDIDDAEELLKHVDFDLIHPAFVTGCRERTDGDRLFCCSSLTASVKAALISQSCSDYSCKITIGGTDGMDVDSPEPKASVESGSMSTDPIVVDSDVEVGVSTKAARAMIRIFDVQLVGSINDVVLTLAQCAGVPAEEKDPSEGFIRRSLRKRKTRYPVGSVQSEESVQVDLKGNVATLRLTLLERCTESTPYKLQHTLKLLVSPPLLVPIDMDNDPLLFASPRMVNLGFDKNEFTLSDICEEALECKLDQLGKVEDHVFLVRLSELDESAGDIPDESLMDHLISISSALVNGNKERKASKRSEERGFSGTLLSRGTQKPTTAETPTSSSSSDTSSVPPTKKTKTDVDLLAVAPLADDEEAGFVALESPAPAPAPADSDKTKPKANDEVARSSKTEDKRNDSIESNGFSRLQELESGELKDQGDQEEVKPNVRTIFESDDDDEFDELLSFQPFAKAEKTTESCNGHNDDPTRKQCNQGVSWHADTSVREDLDRARKQCNQGVSWDADTSVREDLVVTLTELLLKIDGVSIGNQSECFNAAAWAVQKHPSEQDANELRDVAYAKYLEGWDR